MFIDTTMSLEDCRNRAGNFFIRFQIHAAHVAIESLAAELRAMSKSQWFCCVDGVTRRLPTAEKTTAWLSKFNSAKAEGRLGNSLWQWMYTNIDRIGVIVGDDQVQAALQELKMHGLALSPQVP